MSFIAIDAKADIQGSKKGKITPAQHAQLNAWCLASKTGILDCLDKCVATANSYTALNNISTVVFKKGYIVICGRIVECEEGTEVKITTPTTGSVTGKIILKYDLSASEEKEFEVTTKIGDLIKEDLNSNPITGIYEFELYSYTATPTGITLVRNNEDYIPDIGGKLLQFEKSLTAEGKPLGGYDASKGTIEERFDDFDLRLSHLGFREGTLAVVSAMSPSTNYIRRQGNYVYGKLVRSGRSNNASVSKGGTLFTIPANFLPKESISCDVALQMIIGSGTSTIRATLTINTNGNAVIDYTATSTNIRAFDILFGYEAKPL